jgi:hypothetical protein
MQPKIKDKRWLEHDKVTPIGLTEGQYCNLYQIGRSTLRKLAAAGRVRTYVFGPRTIRYDAAPPTSEGDS